MKVTDFLILLVEDDPDQILLTQEALSRANLVNPLRVVEDGEKALDYLAGRGAYADRVQFPLPSLILLDLKLPRVSGLEVLEWMRGQAALKSIPVVVLTASTDHRDMKRAYELGVNSYLCKPVDFPGLLEMMKSIGMYWVILNRNHQLPSGAAESANGTAVHTSRVLLIDPDGDFLTCLTEGLRRRTPPVFSDATGSLEEGLRLLAQQSYDAVVLDRDAATDGPEEALERIHLTCRTPVILLAADGNGEAAGAIPLVLKRPKSKPVIDEVHARVLSLAPKKAPPPEPVRESAEPSPARIETTLAAGRRQDTEILGHQIYFQKTSWDLVRAAHHADALDSLIRIYWKPLYFFIRQKGYDNETAKDLVQDFLTTALERGILTKADPARGRFRTFLLTALTNFLTDWKRASGRQKRGGGQVTLSLDFDGGEREYTLEVAAGETPDTIVNRAWAQGLLDQCISELKGKESHLRAFELVMRGADYQEVSRETGLSESAAKTAVHRLRQQLRDILLGCIRKNMADPEEIELALAEFVSFLQ